MYVLEIVHIFVVDYWYIVQSRLLIASVGYNSDADGEFSSINWFTAKPIY